MTSRSTLIEAGQITSLRVGAMHRYWQSKCRDGSLPLRAAIDPTEIPRLLPYLVIAEIEASPMRVRYRLVGTQVVEDNGSDFTNRYLEDCNFAVEALLHRMLSTAGRNAGAGVCLLRMAQGGVAGSQGRHRCERDRLLSAQQRRRASRSRDLPRRSECASLSTGQALNPKKKSGGSPPPDRGARSQQIGSRPAGRPAPSRGACGGAAASSPPPPCAGSRGCPRTGRRRSASGGDRRIAAWPGAGSGTRAGVWLSSALRPSIAVVKPSFTNRLLMPDSGCVRTTGWLTGGLFLRALSHLTLSSP